MKDFVNAAIEILYESNSAIRQTEPDTPARYNACAAISKIVTEMISARARLAERNDPLIRRVVSRARAMLKNICTTPRYGDDAWTVAWNRLNDAITDAAPLSHLPNAVGLAVKPLDKAAAAERIGISDRQLNRAISKGTLKEPLTETECARYRAECAKPTNKRELSKAELDTRKRKANRLKMKRKYDF